MLQSLSWNTSLVRTGALLPLTFWKKPTFPFNRQTSKLFKNQSSNICLNYWLIQFHVSKSKWFEAYGERLSSLDVKDNPRHLWNFDETGMQNIHDTKKVVGLTGKQAYNVTAMEKGVTSTYLAGINAVGTAVPPIIHKSKVVGKNWKNGAPCGTVVRATETGWITKEVFLEYGQLFVKFLKDQNLMDGLPHVVVMDNHHCHAFNLEFLQLMKDNNIVVFGLPSHTSHSSAT